MTTPTSEEIDVRLHYAGRAVDGRMDAQQLATSLTGLTELIDAVSDSDVWPTGMRPTLYVSDTRKGSFEIVAVLQWLWENSGHLSDLLAGVGMIGALFAWTKNHARKRIKDFEHIPDRDAVKVTFTDGEVVELTQAQWKLVNDARARRALRKLLSPLEPDSVDSLKLTVGPEQAVFTPEDKKNLEEPTSSHERVQRYETTAQPARVDFDSSKSWRLHTLDGELSATIEDRDFIRKVETSRIRLSRSDKLKIRVRVELSSSPTKGDTERRFIERVIDYEPGAVQDELPTQGEA